MIIIPIPRTEYQMFIRSKNGGQYDMKKVFFILINKCSFKNAAKIVIIVHINFYSDLKSYIWRNNYLYLVIMKKYIAEMIGTMVLVLMGCGSAVLLVVWLIQ